MPQVVVINITRQLRLQSLKIVRMDHDDCINTINPNIVLIRENVLYNHPIERVIQITSNESKVVAFRKPKM